MTTRAEYQSSWSRHEPGSRQSSYESDTTTNANTNSSGGGIGSAVNSMITAPFWMTAAGINWMTSNMQRLGEAAKPNGVHTPPARPWNEQDLSGDDLKYVSWTVIFTKPGYEAVLEPMQCDLVSYSTDSSSYAAMKIAKFMERARYGKAEKPHGWFAHDYPSEPAAAARRTETTAKADGSKSEGSKQETAKVEVKKNEQEGWRLPSDDQKYVQFLYRVEWRLPKQEAETARVERVTVERTSNAHAKIVV
jgi:hypothetical protein